MPVSQCGFLLLLKCFATRCVLGKSCWAKHSLAAIILKCARRERLFGRQFVGKVIIRVDDDGVVKVAGRLGSAVFHFRGRGLIS